MKKLTGLIHTHSKFSYDSMVSISAIIKFIKSNQLDFVILTDHNTINGSLALRAALKDQGISNVQVPIAAEYHTEYGDIIAAFIESEINYKQPFNQVVQDIHQQDGLILFPHPYKNHSNISQIAIVSDLIEVYNSRQSEKDDDMAIKLQKNHNKPAYWASDAHSIKEYSHVVCELEYKSNSLKEALLNGHINAKVLTKTSQKRVLVSQIIKHIKQRDLKKVLVKMLVFCKLFINKWVKS